MSTLEERAWINVERDNTGMFPVGAIVKTVGWNRDSAPPDGWVEADGHWENRGVYPDFDYIVEKWFYSKVKGKAWIKFKWNWYVKKRYRVPDLRASYIRDEVSYD